MSDNIDEKLDKIIELLEKIADNTDPLNPWGITDVKSAVDNVKSSVQNLESETKKIRRRLTD